MGARLGLAALLFALVVGGVLAWELLIADGAGVSTDDAFVRADVTPMSARVDGYVRDVPVADNQAVRAGDLLVQVEDVDYRAQLAQADANVEAAEAAIANIGNQRALQVTLIAQAEANIMATRADLARTRAESDRQRALLSTGIAGTRQAVEQASAADQRSVATLALNQAQLAQQQRQLDIYGTQERQARAALRAQEAVRDLARINLGHTRITAPVDGTVGERAVRPGQLVRAGTQVITLVPAAPPWVVANFKETQLARMRDGDAARLTVDSYPGLALTGRVQSLSPASGAQFALLPPDNATGNFTKVTQRIPVKIVLDPIPDAGRLRPGMSVVVRVTPRGPP